MSSQKNLKEKVYKNILDRGLIKPGDVVYVALSGGADSVCLLNILFEIKIKLGFELRACHYNHKMRGKDSDADERFAGELCEKLGVKLEIGAYQGKEKLTSELGAREVRYAFFEKILKKNRGAKVALAHNANDQSETLLIRLIRGSGVEGLKSIPHARKNFIRPLLPFSRSEIEQYLKEKKLKFRTDKTNFDPKYLRNRIRHQIIPLLKEINPKIVEILANTADLVEEDFGLIEAQALKAFGSIIIKKDNKEIVLDGKKFIAQPPAIQRYSIRIAARELGVIEDISSIHIIEAVKLVNKNIGKKRLPLPHSLLIELKNARIYMSREG